MSNQTTIARLPLEPDWDGSTKREHNEQFWLTHPYWNYWLGFQSVADRQIISDAINEIEESTKTAYTRD